MQSTLELLKSSDPDIYAAMLGEEARERDGIELIPSENYAFPEIYATNGSVFANKYAEGYPGRRYYGGQEFTDRIETLAIAAREDVVSRRARKRSAVERLADEPSRVHGVSESWRHRARDGSCRTADISHMARQFHRWGKSSTSCATRPSPPDGHLDYDAVRATALSEIRPKLVLCGHSSYPRELDYARFRAIADAVGALTMADVSHIGGLIAGGVLKNPLDAGFDVVTTTTHKSLRGPRGGMILCKASLATKIDQAVFPGMQGGPHMNAVAGIAVTMKLAATPEIRSAMRSRCCKNAQALAAGAHASSAAL